MSSSDSVQFGACNSEISFIQANGAAPKNWREKFAESSITQSRIDQFCWNLVHWCLRPLQLKLRTAGGLKWPCSANYHLSSLFVKVCAGRCGLVVRRPTAVRGNPGSNLTAAGRVYHESLRSLGTGCACAPLLQCLGRLKLPPSVGR